MGIWAFWLPMVVFITQSQTSICIEFFGLCSVYNALKSLHLHSDSSQHIIPINWLLILWSPHPLTVDFSLEVLFLLELKTRVTMAAHKLIVASLLLCCLAETCYGKVLFTSLKRTLDVTASPKLGQGKTLENFYYIFPLNQQQDFVIFGLC